MHSMSPTFHAQELQSFETQNIESLASNAIGRCQLEGHAISGI
mgnify:CR=1 FL=1